MSERVTRDSRGYWTLPSLPDDARIVALLPEPARAAWDDYQARRRRFGEVLDVIRAVQEGSPQQAEARRLDLEAANRAVAEGRPAPVPVHGSELRAEAAAAELELVPLADAANGALGRIEAVLIGAQPDLVHDAFRRMNASLGDRKAGWRQRLDAVALLRWTARVHETLAWTPMSESQQCTDAEMLLATLPSEAARRVVEDMPEALRRALSDVKVGA